MLKSLTKNKEDRVKSSRIIHHYEERHPTSRNFTQRIVSQLHKTTPTSWRRTVENILRKIIIAHKTIPTVDTTTQDSTQNTDRINRKKIFR